MRQNRNTNKLLIRSNRMNKKSILIISQPPDGLFWDYTTTLGQGKLCSREGVNMQRAFSLSFFFFPGKRQVDSSILGLISKAQKLSNSCSYFKFLADQHLKIELVFFLGKQERPIRLRCFN